MIARISSSQPLLRAAMAIALLALGVGLSGCAAMSDSMTSAFADPAKYDLYECKQLESERKNLASRAAELQGLMAKAETGAAVAALLALAAGLAGCAEMGDSMSSAFADPAKYELYECKQLEAERKSLTARAADLQGLMAKARTGVAGSVVAEMAYRNEYIAVRGQTKFAEEAWQRGKCREATPAGAAPAAAAASPKPAPPASRSGSAVY